MEVKKMNKEKIIKKYNKQKNISFIISILGLIFITIAIFILNSPFIIKFLCGLLILYGIIDLITIPLQITNELENLKSDQK